LKKPRAKTAQDVHPETSKAFYGRQQSGRLTTGHYQTRQELEIALWRDLIHSSGLMPWRDLGERHGVSPSTARNIAKTMIVRKQNEL
jgi:hypothetical protein